MLDQITEIDLRDLPLLRDLFATAACYSSKNYSAYITIDTYIRWFQQDPMVKYVTFYCLNGDFSRGTFIVIVSTKRRNAVSISSFQRLI